MKRSQFVIVCLSGILLGISFNFALKHSLAFAKAAERDGLGAADEWESWSTHERIAYVRGYTGGYSAGSSEACDNADQLFEIKARNLLENGTPNNPVELCDSTVDHFTRMRKVGNIRSNFSMYSDIISEFYAKYPRYKNAPFSFLMKLLSDKNANTADELFSKLEQHSVQGTF